MVGVGVQENRDDASDIRYIANQIGCHDSRIDDNNRDLRDLMGTIDIIKEEVLKMSRMSLCNRYQERKYQEYMWQDVIQKEKHS